MVKGVGSFGGIRVVLGLGFRGFRVEGLIFRVWGLEFWASDFLSFGVGWRAGCQD